MKERFGTALGVRCAVGPVDEVTGRGTSSLLSVTVPEATGGAWLFYAYGVGISDLLLNALGALLLRWAPRRLVQRSHWLRGRFAVVRVPDVCRDGGPDAIRELAPGE